MKNMLLIIAAALFGTNDIAAQIILTQDSYPASVIGTDSLKMTTYTSAFPSLTAAVDGMWNMSIVTDSTPVFYAYRVPSVTYQFADSNIYSLFGYAGYNYQGNVQSSITSGAIVEYSINIQQDSFSLYYVTSTPTDSLFIDSQSMAYSLPRIKIAFPATNSSSWYSIYYSDLNFQLSVSNSLFSFSYNHAPGILRRYTTEKDSVIGWGKMSIKDASGSSSPFLNVLQVQTIITTVDSFFINGTPFPNLLLTYLRLTQSQSTTTHQQNYYRPEELTPLAQVIFTDATYSQPLSAITHIQHLSVAGVPNVINEANINVYPNPVTDNVVSIDLPANVGKWFCEITDITGKIIKSGSLQVNGGHAQFTLSPSITPGVYYVRLYNNANQICIKPIDIIR